MHFFLMNLNGINELLMVSGREFSMQGMSHILQSAYHFVMFNSSYYSFFTKWKLHNQTSE